MNQDLLDPAASPDRAVTREIEDPWASLARRDEMATPAFQDFQD